MNDFQGQLFDCLDFWNQNNHYNESRVSTGRFRNLEKSETCLLPTFILTRVKQFYILLTILKFTLLSIGFFSLNNYIEIGVFIIHVMRSSLLITLHCFMDTV